MKKELSNSSIDRQNILNNQFVLEKIQQKIGIQGILFEEKICFTKKQIAEFYEVSESTIKRYLEQHEEELQRNGYEVLKGQRLKKYKKNFTRQASKEAEISFGMSINDLTKITVFGIFDFRSFLNIGMLLTESKKAKEVRSFILNISIDSISEKSGGNTVYINQREKQYLESTFHEENYRKKFTNSLDKYVDMGPQKYPIYTNKIYKSIFKENATEYRSILKLKSKHKTRDTFYSEIIDMISSYENGLAKRIERESKKIKRKLSSSELSQLYIEFEEDSKDVLAPHIHNSRKKMASRDLCFRDALHQSLKEYVEAVSREDFENFLGEKSKEFSERLEETKDVFKRLKDR